MEAIALLWRHRQLTWEMTKREISERYAGQAIGTLWAVGHPLAQIAVYIFVFGFVFTPRTQAGGGERLSYITYLLAGLIPWISFQDALSKSTSVIVSRANLVKQVVFPIEILPAKSVLSSMITQSVATGGLMIFVGVVNRGYNASHALVPVLFFFQFLAMTGAAYVVSSVGVYLRDLKEFMQLWSLIGLYLVPIAYNPSWVPAMIRPVFLANPYAHLVWCFQDAIHYGRFEHPCAWVVFPVGSVLLFFGGYRVFRRLKVSFGNVL